MKQKIDRLLTMNDLMQIFPRSKKTIMSYVKHLPRVEVGHSVYWKESVIRDFIEANTKGGAHGTDAT